MDAIALLNQTQIEFVSDPALGASETIEYTHNSGTVVSVRVFVELGEFNDSIADDKKVNSITIGNVVLSEVPTTVDKFTHKGISYQVRDWTGHGMYQIFAENEKRNRVSSRNRR